jgi:hypothetical protein
MTSLSEIVKERKQEIKANDKAVGSRNVEVEYLST